MNEIKEELRRFTLLITPTEEEQRRSSRFPQVIKSASHYAGEKPKVSNIRHVIRHFCLMRK